ncbi:hypothetical protein ACHAXA_000124 [Cyclostephanos tholiformis]|uniref:Uncharacterized protein n=1 Tax=Cyclostephanos tholiformis TaxID=382380 RepID=A0ABD3RXW1_9STRA
MADAERSSIEIKVLLRNLDPNKSSIKHKDRIRRLNKFRDYVTARPPPEFYDDDYNLLLLGSESPTVMENEELEGVNLVGLLRASGCPRSVDHMDALKRSARPAISLLRYLCLDFGGDAEPSSAVGENASRVVGLLSRRLNGFASALCALNVPQLRLLRFDIHVGGGTDCGGSKDDACRLLALILTRHTDTDRETPKPLRVHDVLPDARSRAIFDSWLGENASPDVRRAIRENINAASNSGGGDHAMGGGGGAAAAAESISSAAAVAEGEVGRGRNPFQNDDDVNEDFLKVLGKKSRSILDYARSAVFLPKWKGNDGTKSARSAIISPSSSHHDEFNDIDTLDSSSDINSFESRIRAAALSRADEIRNETLQTGGTQDDAETAAVRAVLSNASYDKKNLPGKIGDMVINFVDTVHARLCPGNTNYGGGTYSSTLREFLYHVDLTVLPFCGSEESENQSVGPVNPSKWKRESTVSTSLRHVRSIVAPLPYIATPNESHAIDAGGREVSFEEDDYANLCTRYLTPRIIKKVELITRKTDRAEVYRLLCQLRDWELEHDSCSGSITRGNDYNPNWRDSIRDRELDQGRVPTALRDDAGDKDILESFDVTKDGDETAGSEFIDVDEYIANVFSLQTKHQAASSGGPVYRYV